MPDLLSLALRAADLATRPARFVAGRLYERVRGSDDAPAYRPTSAPAPPRAEPPQTPRQARPKAKPSPKAARRAVRNEPTKGQAAQIRAEQREAEWGDGDGPGAEITIDERLKNL